MRKLLVRLIAAYIYHTPPHPGRGILGKIAWRLDPHPFVAETPDGIKVKVRLNDVNSITAWARGSKGTCWEEHHDRHVFCSFLREGMTVMDVGANIGVYALLAARTVGPTGKVYAFEPVPEIFTQLQEHIALNNATNIIPVPIALADKKGTAKMSVAGGMSSLFRHETSRFIEVPLERLDDFVAEQGIERVDAIKIDVEGAELAVIKGADKTLRQHKPLLMVEIQEATLKAAGTTPQELFDTIVGYGYDAFVVRHGKAAPVNGLVEPWRYPGGYRFDNYLFLPKR